MSENEFDAVVIGSGMGGLTFGSIYAQLMRKRVLLLERHYVPGGFTHSFSRKNFRWDVGLHYVGGMEFGSQPRQLMDLVTGAAVDWQPLPDEYDVFHYPGLTVKAHRSPEKYREALCKQFPRERRAIVQYFEDVEKTAMAIGVQIWSWSLPRWIAAPVRWANGRADQLSRITLAEYLGRNVGDDRLRAILASHWGDYGLLPERVSFATHALITASYFGGAYFPLGGASSIAKAAIDIVRSHGGDCRTNHPVSRILLERGTAVGVEVNGRRIMAPLVISNAGSENTYQKLLGASPVASVEPGTAAVTLYLGLKESPAKIGICGENHWVHESFQHAVSQRIQSVFVSFGSLNDPKAQAHTAQVMAVVEPQMFDRWRTTKWHQRGYDYEELKKSLSERLLELAEIAAPGLISLVSYQELSTPLSVEHFTGSPNIYGAPGTTTRFRERKLTVATTVKNLLLTGADACSLGIQGAMMGGVFAAAHAMHPLLGFPKVLRAAAHAHRTRVTRESAKSIARGSS